ncbi:MAG: hypothetical protein JSR73_01265 [Proteobacteria bacterium]|nr:hypothetical protein [Pseudomonadota bacterium]
MRSKWLVGAVLALTGLGAVGARAADEAGSGFWLKREYLFSYAGFTSHYSCNGIEDKLRELLKAAGARSDLKVLASCSEPMGAPSRIATARLTFYVLGPEAAATPPKPGAAAPKLEPGDGVWKKVAWRSREPYWLEAGDCELVEQFDKELLPMMTVRNHESHFNCVPHQLTLGAIDVRFEALSPAPKAAH